MGIFMKKPKFLIIKFTLIFIVAIVGIFGSYQAYHFFKGTPLSFDIRKTSGGPGIEKWTKFDPKEERFIAHFPNKPEYIEKIFPIPRSTETLPYHEYQSFYEDLIVSVSYTVLPEDWLRWGSSLVLKGAIKVVMSELKDSHLVGQAINTFKSYPSLDFEHYLGSRETAGTLILVENTLYKIEISYPVDQKEETHNILSQFIASFEPVIK
jgi:hypothetical protein